MRGIVPNLKSDTAVFADAGECLWLNFEASAFDVHRAPCLKTLPIFALSFLMLSKFVWNQNVQGARYALFYSNRTKSNYWHPLQNQSLEGEVAAMRISQPEHQAGETAVKP